jgi:hypothetical protein
VRLIELIRAGWGTAMLAAPRSLLAHVHGVQADRTDVAVARVLGARQLVQGVLSGLAPSPEVLAAGVWVDVAHATSMAALPLLDRSRARVAATDAAIASLFAGLGWRDLARPTDPAAEPDRRDRLVRAVLARLPGGPALLARAGRGGRPPARRAR